MSYKKLCAEIINSDRFPIETTVFISEREFIKIMPSLLAHKESNEWPIEKIIESIIVRYGLNGNTEQTISDVANQFGESYGRLQRVHAKAMRLLRKPSNIEKIIPGIDYK